MSEAPRCDDGEQVSDSTRRTVKATGIAIGMVLLVLFLWYAVDVLLLAFAGVLIAILLRTLSDYAGRWTRLSERWSLVLVVLLLLGVTVLAGRLVAPSISRQVDALGEKLPDSLRALQATVSEYRWAQWLFSNNLDPQQLMPAGRDLMQRTTGIVSRTVNILFSLIIVVFVAIYLAAEPGPYIRGFLHLVPCGGRERAHCTIMTLGDALRRWIFATMFSMAVIGLLTFIGLWLLGIPLAFTLAATAGLLNAVPNFGPIASVVPAAMLALLQSPAKVWYVVLLYVAVQHFETYLLTPMVQRKAVSLPPVLTILSQVLMGILAGPLGLILATPLLASVLVVVQMLYVRDALGDRVPVAGQVGKSGEKESDAPAAAKNNKEAS